MALIIKAASGEVSEFDLKNASLHDWQKAVDGWVESLTFTNLVQFQGHDYAGMFLDEEGKIKGKPENIIATPIAHAGGLHRSDCIVGDVILWSKGEIE